MKTFLHELANTLYERYGDGISNLEIVFPSRRAQLFFIDELRSISIAAGRPIWQPKFATIDSLMSELSPLKIADRTRLIVELYRVYSQFHDESFDKFYAWGDLLLSDFDTVDKYLVDADMLFRNILDIKELEADISYLSIDQLQLIRQFWSNFAEEGAVSVEKQRFLKIWKTLSPVYQTFKSRLAEQVIAYPGMVHRDAVERLKNDGFESEKEYIIVGFNALTQCELRLFKHLSRNAEFVWDFDNYYVDDKFQEAGVFLRENVQSFKASLEVTHDNFLRDKQIDITSTTSNAIQCKHVNTLLRGLQRTFGTLGKETAIVLTDESLLIPLLHALPADLKVNVTMGYPLRQSHEYAEWEQGDDKKKLSFQNILSENPIANYLNEELTKLANSLDECRVDYSPKTFTAIARKHLQSLRIPYEGEPLDGIQVMGILETRNIDFKNVIVLSCSDDVFPGKHTSNASFVPYNLRAAYGLPTPEYHEGTQAYLFYRLLQRAENVHLLYCSHADEKTTGEPSRYIYQLEYESPHKISRHTVGIDIDRVEITPIAVPKTGEVAEKLRQFLLPMASVDAPRPAGACADAAPWKISPTSFFRYIACPLKFYFHSIAGLRPADPVGDEVDAPMFGTILHSALQYLYGASASVGEGISIGDAGGTEAAARVETAVIRAINENYLRNPDASPETYTGNLLLIKEIASHYVRNVVAYDRANPDFTTIALEQQIHHDFTFAPDRSVRFAGVADRIDRIEGFSEISGRDFCTERQREGGSVPEVHDRLNDKEVRKAPAKIRIIDYKTGEPHLEFKSLGDLFHGDGKQRQSAIIQTLLYSMMSSSEGDSIPNLYYVRDMYRPDYSPLLVDKERDATGLPYSAYKNEFEVLLRTTLTELFDETIPFTQCNDPVHTCRYCDFKEICKR